MPFCPCCRSKNAQFRTPKVPDGLPARASVCGVCMRHLGDGPQASTRRESDHREQWEYDVELLEQRHADQVKVLHGNIEHQRAEIRELQDELDSRPFRIVTENLDQQTVDDALEKRGHALRSRDYAYRRLCEVRLLHHDTGDGTCACGGRADHCAVAKLVDTYRALDLWEGRQWRRKQQGLDHMLPDGHLGLVDPHWRSEPDDDHLQFFPEDTDDRVPSARRIHGPR